VPLSQGDLVAVDRTSRAVFRVDTTTGAQTLISQAARLLAPQGVAQRDGELVVADPAGLVVVSASGAQRLVSPPLAAGESLQVAFDAAGDALVVEQTGLSKLDWNPFGAGSLGTWLAVPTSEPIPYLALLHGDALAIEASGDVLTGGLSLLGDGVFRLSGAPPAVSILLPGFANVKWLDLALESDGDIVAVGFDYDVATGVYRISPTTGVFTPINNSFGWLTPTGVSVAPNGDLYVADAGTCANGSCSGGRIVRVDPVSGAATPLSSGGLIAGELDVVALPEPGLAPSWLAALAALGALHRLRSSRRRR
jgi:hypothetical protein